MYVDITFWFLVFLNFFLIACAIRFSFPSPESSKRGRFEKVLIIILFSLILGMMSIINFQSGEGNVVSIPASYAQQLRKGVVYHVIVGYTDGKHDNILNITSGKYYQGEGHKIVVIRVKNPAHFRNFMLNQNGIPIRIFMNK